MEITLTLNGKKITSSIEPDTLLLDFCRAHQCKSVKRGCDTSNCGLCTVWMDGKPVLSCNVLAARANGHSITTLEGLQTEAAEFGTFLANEGGEQCGFCNPGFIMNVLAMKRELQNPTEDEILEYLSGNLCRCTGYSSHMRAIRKWLGQEQEAIL
jgi:carbon-monoxide dehydrogenase small subunit